VEADWQTQRSAASYISSDNVIYPSQFLTISKSDSSYL